jgi:predicted Zn-dependent peptidase
MFQTKKLKNGLTLITIPMPHLDSVTSLVAVGTGSRYETKKINGISHFLEHMFFKGSKKYPTAEMISNLVDGIGAINNAGTEKEWTDYWIKSSSKHLELSADILSSMLKDSLLAEEEIEREKGVIIEEIRMYNDIPSSYVDVLFEQLLFGNQPLGWDIAGDEKTIMSLKREDFVKYVDSLYSPKNMAVVFAGKLPKNIEEIAEKYFEDLPVRGQHKSLPYKKNKQLKPRVNVFYKKTDQAHINLGVEGYDRNSPKRFAARILGVILGQGMSSRLFIQVRERRGLAYHIGAGHGSYTDTGVFKVAGALKVEKVEEGIEVIKAELARIVDEKVTDDELKKAKEMIRGRIALSSESTNFLAEHFALSFVLDRKLETFEEYLKNIEAVTVEDVQKVAQELIKPELFNLQVIGPFKNPSQFEKLLK